MRPLNRETLESQAFQTLRTAIRTGELKPGQRLIEGTLATSMGVSRIPIREAIRSLERYGLVVSQPGRGACVVNPSTEDVHEIYGLRQALECYALELVINGPHHGDAVERLQELASAMGPASRSHRRDELMKIDLRFHETLCELSGNNRLLDAWHRLSDQVAILLQLKDLVHDDSGDLPGGHQRIVDAIRTRSVASAQQLLRAHIARSASRLLPLDNAP